MKIEKHLGPTTLKLDGYPLWVIPNFVPDIMDMFGYEKNDNVYGLIHIIYRGYTFCIPITKEESLTINDIPKDDFQNMIIQELKSYINGKQIQFE